jgi:hypothetical protein
MTQVTLRGGASWHESLHDAIGEGEMGRSADRGG